MEDVTTCCYVTEPFIYIRVHCSVYTREHGGGDAIFPSFETNHHHVDSPRGIVSGGHHSRLLFGGRANARENAGCMPGVSYMMDCGRPLCSH